MSDNLFPVVGVGASAGGLDAFRKLLKAIPEKSGMAYVLVQHLAPNHESQLPELLQKVTTIPVVEISDDIQVEPDHIYILPSNKMLVANDGVLELSPRIIEKNKLNLPIDLFFASLAQIHHQHAIGVVLSGTGNDGTEGLRAIKANGGITIAQDEASASYDGMPRSAAQAGVADYILPPGEIPEHLMAIQKKPTDKGSERPVDESGSTVFTQLLTLLQMRTGTDFTYYKQTTIRRRIRRRMAIHHQETPADYLAYVQANQPEQDALYQDMLIQVTSFFREPAVFQQLCETVFPRIISAKPAGESIRIWVAGCSTGQEVYSMAICLAELLGDNTGQVQLFATDLSKPAIAKARSGMYSKGEVASVSALRLDTFFTRAASGSYQIIKSVRDMCVFAVHDFLKDPPFSKLDLISCRNVLIYLEPYLQKKAFATFHFALNQKGNLLLGKSETVNLVSGLFTMTAKDYQLFARTDGPGQLKQLALGRSAPTKSLVSPRKETMRTDFQKIADDLLLRNYTPAGVVVNESMDIVHFRGKTTPYLEQVEGKPTHNLLLLARNGLAFELRTLIHKAKQTQAPVFKENLPLPMHGGSRFITLEAVRLPQAADPHYLILFHEVRTEPALPEAVDRKTSKRRAKQDTRDRRIQQLEQELAQNREDMRGITQDHEAIHEELQSANEELLSGNEELQSLNEELETGKEEVQSANEELTVVNQEMIKLNAQVTDARDYAEGIVATVREPLLVLDKHLRVKTANNAYYEAFRVNRDQTEGQSIYEVGNKDWAIPALKELLENILPRKTEFNDFELTHSFYQIGKRVMRLNAREIKEGTSEKLILLAIDDVTEQKRVQAEQQQVQKRFQFIANSIPQKVWTTDEEGRLNYVNDIWLSYTGLSIDTLKHWNWKKIIHPDDWEDYKTHWQHSLDTGENFEVEQRLLHKDGVYRWHLSRGLAYQGDNGKLAMLWVGTDTEIQEQKHQQEALENAVYERTRELDDANQALEKQNRTLLSINKELHTFTHVTSHDLQEPLRKIQTLVGRILDKEQQTLTVAGKDYFQRIQHSAGRMRILIQDLLAFSRLNSGNHTIENADLRALASKVIADFAEVAGVKQATFITDELGHAPVIVVQFHQILHHLIDNALKFSSPDRPLLITIKSQLLKGNKTGMPTLLADQPYCHITFTDTGIGFDPQYSEKIFDIFQRLQVQAQYEGTGMGLALVRKIVENHHGLIKASSELGKGAKFDLYIPAP